MTAADRNRSIRSLLAGAAALASLAIGSAAQAGAQPYTQAFGATQSAVPAPIAPLSDSDARTYAAAFDAVKKGQFGMADAIVGAVQDTCLQGRVQYAKLMHSAYKATYGELKTWLDSYRDQPGADRIFIMAKKRRAAEAAGAAAPADIDAALAQAQDTGPAEPIKDMDPRLQQSREAFYAGDVDTAYALATAGGERWIAGMASYRLGKFDEAFKWLSDLAQDEAQNEWVRSGAAWWAARSAATAGLTEQAGPYLKMAASTPYTFYGLIAAHQLGLDSVGSIATPQPLPQPSLFQRASDARPTLTPAMVELVMGDARARRAAALAQAGLKREAGAEIRTALLGAGDSAARQMWRDLSYALNAPLTSPDDLRRISGVRFDPAQYDAPELKPRGGFTLEKALVYAIVRQESRFNTDAVSASGAYGLMQLMPATAGLVNGDARRPVAGSVLKNPAENLRIGQAYVQKLLDSVSGDLIRTVASYNSGPGTILKTVARLGPDADSLLVIENMPGAQTREYVERVMSNYWIYRKLWSLPSPSLDAVAAGQAKVPAILDANRGQGAKLARAD